ncbi:MAG: ATP-binding protein [Bacteroidota bacterium]
MDKSEPKRSIRAFILLGFILAISAVAIMGYQAYRSVNALANDLQEAATEDPYLASLNQILNALTSAESDVRAYTITRDTQEDKPKCEAAILGVNVLLEEIEETHAGKSSFTQIQKLIEEKLEIMQDLTALVDTNQSREVYERFSKELDKVVKANRPERVSSNVPDIKPVEAPEPVKSVTVEEPEVTEEMSRAEARRQKKRERKEKGNFIQRLLNNDQKANENKTPLEVGITPPIVSNSPSQEATELPQNQPQKPASVSYRPEKMVQELQSSLTEIEAEELIEREIIQGEIAELTREGQEVMRDIKSMVKRLEARDSKETLVMAENAEEQADDTTNFIAWFSSGVLLLCLVLIAVIFGDMARNNRLQRRLQEEKGRAEKLAKVKEEFLANMSHEIRTPMNALIGFSEQLAQTPLRAKQSSLLQPIRNSAHYLLALINDILDYSKLESGKFKLENTTFQPLALLNEVLQTLQPLAQKKGIALKGEGFAALPLALKGDPLRLRQMLFNLLGNAIKFTEEGSVRLKAEILKTASKSVELQFAIIDTGIGIPEDQLKKVFQNFVQADSGTTRRFGGTGLGLSITQKLAKLHKGEVKIDSQLGKGTTVSLVLPYSIGREEDVPQKPQNVQLKPQQLQGKKILVADDEAYNRELIAIILDKWGVEAKIVNDGKEALAQVKQQAFDIILMDLRMPELDGIEVTKETRKLGIKTPILALTATSTEEEISTALEAGMNGHLLKPFQEADLLATISHLLGLPMDVEVETLNPAKEAVELEGVSAEDQFSLVHLEKLTNHNPQALERMLQLFLGAATENISGLEQAIVQRDWESISMRAHKLVPPCRHLGLEGLVSQLKAIEAQADRQEDWEGLVQALTEGLEKLKTVVSKVEARMEA